MTRRKVFTIASQGIGGIAGLAVVLPAVGFAHGAALSPRQGALGVGRLDRRLQST